MKKKLACSCGKKDLFLVSRAIEAVIEQANIAGTVQHAPVAEETSFGEHKDFEPVELVNNTEYRELVALCGAGSDADVHEPWKLSAVNFDGGRSYRWENGEICKGCLKKARDFIDEERQTFTDKIINAFRVDDGARLPSLESKTSLSGRSVLRFRGMNSLIYAFPLKILNS